MTAHDHKECLRRAYADMSLGNPQTFMELLAPDVVYTVIGSTAFSHVLRGRDELLERLVLPLGSSLATPLSIEIQTLIAEGDAVAMPARGHSTLQSGAPYNNTYCFVFRFSADHIAEVTEYLDTALVARAFGVPAQREKLLQHMDLNMWEMFRDIVRLGRGGELLETPELYMGASPRGAAFHNMAMIKGPIEIDALFAAIRGFFVERGRAFSIWVRAHADAALEAALRERGFTQFITMPGMALLGDPGTPCKPADLKIRRATTEEGRRDYQRITADAYATYGAPPEYAADAFASLESVCAPHIQGFIGYVKDKPVAAATVYVSHGVAGIGWVGTVPEHRGHGFAEAVTWAAIREGFRHGAGFANLQAAPMGRPIYERMGFITPTEYRVLVGHI